MSTPRIILLLMVIGISCVVFLQPGSKARSPQAPFNLVAWDSGRYVPPNTNFRTLLERGNIHLPLISPNGRLTLNEIEPQDQNFPAGADFLQHEVSYEGSSSSLKNASRSMLQDETRAEFVGADNGIAFIYDDVTGIRSDLKTSMPVFKAFGLSTDRQRLLYSPLKGRIPSGELFLENLATQTATRITADLILEAALSPNESTIAYTFATDKGFALATVEVGSKERKEWVSENVLPDVLQWNSSGTEIYCFETTGEMNTVVPHKISVANNKVIVLAQSELPSGFPRFSSASDLDRASRDSSPAGPEIHYPFEITSSNLRRVCGSDLFGNSPIWLCESRNLSNQPYLAEGRLLKVTNTGIIIRSFEENKTTIDFVSWQGNRTRLALAPQVSYNLPLSSFTLTQGGASYPSPGSCNISSHTGSLSFAYDMQNPTVGKHVLAAADGLVVNTFSTANCNSGDPNGCSDYSSTCSANGGWGNTVIIQHADATYSRYAHLQFNSIPGQVTVNASVCPGLYLGNQGHTGNTAGNLNGCGDHVHFQKQSSVMGASISASFSDAPSNPLVCNASYTSGSVETATCSNCQSGTSTLNNSDGGPPIHPPGSVIKTASNPTVYLIDSDNRRRPITSPSVLAQLYNQSTDARTSTDFSNWVITVGQNELDLYEQGGDISAAQPGNGKPFPDGKLIGFNGEVSIVTGGGRRRPFVSGTRFTGLGYNFCQVVNVSQSEYNSYSPGPPVEAMPLLVANLNLSPAGPYSVGQNITGNFTIKNVGFESLPFSSVGIGGRFDGLPFDIGFTSTTLAPGSTFPYGPPPRQLTSSGTYDFFVAYQENNGHWAVSVPATPGIIRSRQITVSNNTRTLTVASSNPNSGVSITVTPSDNNGQGSGATQFSRTYNNNANVTLTAPATASGNSFQKWQRDGVDVGTNLQTTVTMDANHTMTAVYASVTRVLTVASSNPGSGVGITISPNDNNSQGSGTTQFTRVYNNNASVTLTAPSSAAGNNFQKWQQDGADVGTSLQTVVTMAANHTMTAVYASAPTTRILTVASSNPSSGVSVTVTPNDNSGQGNGTTQFTRVYANNVNVGLTAPATAGGNSFQKWQRDGSDWTTSQATGLSMDADHVMTAVYSSCAAPGAFSLVSPANGSNLGATNLVTLSWGDSPNASSYDVYFGTNSNPNFWSSVTATSLNVSVNVGQTYWWKVVARVGCSSSLTFATPIWSFSVNGVTPANDNFANAQSISGNSGTVNGTNAQATKEAGEPNHANNSGGASIWYFWSAPADGYVTITTVGSNFDTLLAAYTNSSVSNLTAIASNDDIDSGNRASSVTFNTTAGTVYRIAVDGWAGAMGNTTLNWSFIPDTNRINVALASNGGLATASSATPPDGTGTFFPSVAIDGDHKGLNTSFWRDDTGDSYPDWLQVDFAGSKSIHEIDVYTLQDNYTNPVEPSLNMSFNLYGITAFNVQYWSDFWGWVNVPGGVVTGNTNVWRRFTFADISTTKVRVLVNNALASRSRIVELEAYGVLAPTSKVNVALSSSGGVATASSTTPPDGTGTFVPSVAIDGDHKGLNTSFWRDATGDSYPDWLQVDFAGNKTIHEIDVYTLQDDYTNPVEPSSAMTFSLYGVTNFDVQYWNGSGWVIVPGGSVTGNNSVWRRFTFSDITTSKIRVLVNNALASRSRIVELEAYSLTAPNVASAANGGVASASSTTPPDGTGTFVPSVTIDGDRKGLNTSFWRDGTGDSYPDWLQVDFAGSKTISEIDVYTLQDNYTSPVEPSATMTFNLYGITAFDVQYWTGSSWITVPGGSVSGNNNVWRKFTFSALSTSKIRVLVNNALASRSRVVEVEAY